jgi:hypothetical protein
MQVIICVCVWVCVCLSKHFNWEVTFRQKSTCIMNVYNVNTSVWLAPSSRNWMVPIFQALCLLSVIPLKGKLGLTFVTMG